MEVKTRITSAVILSHFGRCTLCGRNLVQNRNAVTDARDSAGICSWNYIERMGEGKNSSSTEKTGNPNSQFELVAAS